MVRDELGGVDASLVFSARMAGFRLGFELLRPRRPVRRASGLPATSEGNIELNPFEFFMKDPTDHLLGGRAPCRTCASSSISPRRAR